VSERRRKLTVLIPCFNERDTVLELIERVKRIDVDKRVIVVDNASTDGTREILRAMCSGERSELGADSGVESHAGRRILDGPGFTVVLQPMNLKKGTSVKTGLALADSEYFICQDADLEYDPRDIVRLVEHADRTGASAVFGARPLVACGARLDPFRLGRTMLTRLFCRMYGQRLTDVATCYKLMRTDVARSLKMQASGFDLDFEIPAKLARLEHRIDELPISYVPRGRAGGKKIRWHDGIAAAWTLMKLRGFRA
jgi:glycosyltransferase involved in cell wall biosynthesis